MEIFNDYLHTNMSTTGTLQSIFEIEDKIIVKMYAKFLPSRYLMAEFHPPIMITCFNNTQYFLEDPF